MRSAKEWFIEYGESHTNPLNELIHWICIPLIMLSIIGLLWSIPSDYFKTYLPESINFLGNWATIFVILALFFYLSLSFNLFLGMLIVSVLMIWIVYQLDQLSIPLWLLSIVIFTLSWIAQFYGHKVEGKKPKFLKDVQFLLIGPAWLLSHIYNRLKISY